ncbi:MAG: cation:proton antiporter [Planctomycetota bacterium]|nr:cation:proton antiporter [Planctomycetota bacterium]
MNLAAGGPLLVLGMLLVGGAVGGALARRLRLPTLTGYIGAGITIGAQCFDLLPHEPAEALRGPINNLAMALVLFVLGGQFRGEKLRGIGAKLLALSLVETALTILAVTFACWLVVPRADGALLLGVMAVAVAPATTVVVLREYGARGPTTDVLRMLTAMSNAWAVLLFEVVLLAFAFVRGGDAGPVALLADVGGALAFGLVAGHALIFLQERAGWSGFSVPLLAVTLSTIGLCNWAGVPYMLAFLVAGAVVANRSRLFAPIEQSMDAFAQPAFVAFFVLSGAHLNFIVLREHWLAAGLYILARTVGKIAGTRLGLRLGSLRLPSTQAGSPPIGLGLLCQAGAAIALAQYTATYDPELAEVLLNVILGAVVVFEIIGPLLLKHVVVAAGEVSLAQLMTHGAGRSEQSSPLRAFGRTIRGRKLRTGATFETVRVERVMRRASNALQASSGLDEVLRFANQSRQDTFPIVDQEGLLVGMIRMRDLDQVAYDRSAARLVNAQDIATLGPEECSLRADATLSEAEAFFRQYPENSAAVVASASDARLVGILERTEVLHLHRALRAN